MKATIHPTYNTDATILCACGSTFTVGSTSKDIHVELCSACHPFYTGKQKLLDTSRRIEKFQEKAAKAAGSTAVVSKKAKDAKRAAVKDAKKGAKVEVSPEAQA